MFNSNIKNKIYGYAIGKLGMVDYTRGWMKGNCPICGKSFKFGIHIGQNKAHCFSCDYRARLIPLIGEVEGITNFQQILQFLKAFEGIEYVESPMALQKEYSKVEFPEDYRLIGINKGRIEKSVKGYLKGRGFKISVLQRAAWGYCVKGKYGGRIIIPYFQNGGLVYFTARKFIDYGPKFLNLPEEESGIGKSQLIYNVDALAIYDKIYAFESATNAATMGDTATAYGGKILSRYQKSCILSSRVEKVVIGLDLDAYEEALKLGLELAHHKKVKVLKLPVELDKNGEQKDINSFGKARIREIEKSMPWQSYKELYGEWLSIRSK